MHCHFCPSFWVPVRKLESLELSVPSLFTLVSSASYRQFGSVQSLGRVTLCEPMDSSTWGFPVHHQLSELVQTQVHRVGDASQPPHPLSSLSLTPWPLDLYLVPISQHSTQFLSKRLSFFKLGSLPISPLSVNVLAAVAMKMKPGPVAPSPISWILWMPLPGWSLKSRIWELLVPNSHQVTFDTVAGTSLGEGWLPLLCPARSLLVLLPVTHQGMGGSPQSHAQ